MVKCKTCKSETDELIRGEVCNECNCKELSEENFVETNYDDLKDIANGIIPAGYLIR